MSIRFEEVSKSFGLGGTKKILERVSFEVQKGEILFILGKSGMGKSVTLKHMVGILKPDHGTVTVDGQEVSKMTEHELPAIRAKCGMVFQNPALLDSLTVYENVAFGLKTPQYLLSQKTQLDPTQLRERVLHVLGLVNLGEEILRKYPPEISFGMQKRVSLARTLAPAPSYLLFDEPTTGLDPITTNAVNDLIYSLSRRIQVTSVVVSHDMSCAIKIADRILVLDQAQIVALGTVEEIKQSRVPLVRDFLAETLESAPGPSLISAVKLPIGEDGK